MTKPKKKRGKTKTLKCDCWIKISPVIANYIDTKEGVIRRLNPIICDYCLKCGRKL